MTYYATFRYRRELSDAECDVLFANLRKHDGRRWALVACVVLPESTEVIFEMTEEGELSDILEKAKTRAGKAIIKASGERFPPFYQESYDRIIRDDVELEERLEAIIASPVTAELVNDPEDYACLYVANSPQDGS